MHANHPAGDAADPAGAPARSAAATDRSAGSRGGGGNAGGWIDSHCHLDAAEFAGEQGAVVARARAAGVLMLVLPAVRARDFEALRALAHAHGCAYALGLHPLYVGEATDADLERLAEALRRHRDDPLLVAVGEIGLDHAVAPPAAAAGPDDRMRQQRFYFAQLRLARDAGLPVILHVRRSADALLAGLARCAVPGGIAHAFNGSEQQARRFAERGFRLGFGGAMTFERARQIRSLAAALPAEVPVLETDAPDIPPWWLYTKAEERAAGGAHGRNEPAELPRIAATLAELRGWSLAETAERTSANVHAALPRLAGAVAAAAAATGGTSTVSAPSAAA